MPYALSAFLFSSVPGPWAPMDVHLDTLGDQNEYDSSKGSSAIRKIAIIQPECHA